MASTITCSSTGGTCIGRDCWTLPAEPLSSRSTWSRFRCQPFIGRLKRQTERFGLEPVAAGVNAGYFTAAVCQLTQEMGIALVPGYRRPHRGANDYQKKHFTYDAERDLYLCPAGSELSYGTTDRNGYRHYRSDKTVCEVCPEREKCTRSRGAEGGDATRMGRVEGESEYAAADEVGKESVCKAERDGGV